MKLFEISNITALPSRLPAIKVGDILRNQKEKRDEDVVEVSPKYSPQDLYGPYFTTQYAGHVKAYHQIERERTLFGLHLILVDTTEDGKNVWEFQKRRELSKQEKDFRNKMAGGVLDK